MRPDLVTEKKFALLDFIYFPKIEIQQSTKIVKGFFFVNLSELRLSKIKNKINKIFFNSTVIRKVYNQIFFFSQKA